MTTEAERKAPYETPDAVISAGLHYYGAPHGLSGPHPWRIWWRALLRRKPFSQRFLLHVTYRDCSERTKIVHLAPGLIRSMVDALINAPLVRQVEVAEILCKGRKSFGADYDPEKLFGFIKELSHAPEAAALAKQERPAPEGGRTRNDQA